ncbi:MAG: hypothetical protein ACKN9F_08940, partial [Methylomonas sp.]
CGLLALSGCATMMNDSSKIVQVTSNVPQANFSIKNKIGNVVQNGVTPSSVNLNVSAGPYSGEKFLIDFTKDGYLPSTAVLDSEISGWWFGNLLVFGGILGFAVIDPISGKMWTLPDSVNGQLNQ